MVAAFNPPGIWSPFGTFSMAVLQGDGQVVHLKGQVALDTLGRVVGPRDMRVQVRKTLDNIRDVLASMGGGMSDTISLVHYATDIEAFMSTSDIRKEFFAAPLAERLKMADSVEKLVRHAWGEVFGGPLTLGGYSQGAYAPI